MYIYIKKTHANGKTYYYVVGEVYDPKTKRKETVFHISLQKLLRCIEEDVDVAARLRQWCGGWDLNPRRPTPSGPKPDPFDQARAPPR